jgi:DNA-binding response OmpR family regulator
MFFCFSTVEQVYYIEFERMRKKVLFILNVSTTSIVPELLARTGFRVDVACNSETGLQRLDAQAYDVIIFRESPLAESWLLCEKIRRLTTTPLIVISSNASTETCVKAINAGADYFMRKPFGPLELLARVNSLLQRTASRQPVPLGSQGY